MIYTTKRWYSLLSDCSHTEDQESLPLDEQLVICGLTNYNCSELLYCLTALTETTSSSDCFTLTLSTTIDGSELCC